MDVSWRIHEFSGVFTIMNYLLPKQGILSMHASANEGQETWPHQKPCTHT